MGVPTLLALSLPLWPSPPLPPHFAVFMGGLIVFYALGVALHELGHAVVAWLLGYRVAQIRWGYGPPVFTWHSTAPPFTDVTSNSISPSSIKTLAPGRTSRASCG